MTKKNLSFLVKIDKLVQILNRIEKGKNSQDLPKKHHTWKFYATRYQGLL